MQVIDRCRAKSAHIRQSKPDSGLGSQANVLGTLEVVPSSLGSGRMLVRKGKRECHMIYIYIYIHIYMYVYIHICIYIYYESIYIYRERKIERAPLTWSFARGGARGPDLL